jgi:phage regulator Rha-like protein
MFDDTNTHQPAKRISMPVLCADPDKRHDNVKRTIDALVERGVIEFPQTEEISTATKPSTVYHLGKRDTLVVVATLSPKFTARVVDRWQQLEANCAPAPPGASAAPPARASRGTSIARWRRGSA